jgi:hypothetical protein
VRAITMLARLLTAACTERGCEPQQVPLDVLGYWVTFSQRARDVLGLPRDPLPFDLMGVDGIADQLAGASMAVGHAWLVQSGKLRLGDHVIVTPETRVRPAEPRRGVITWARFDNPDLYAGIAPGRLSPDPFRVGVRLDSARGETEIPQDPWGLLLDEAWHPREGERARAIRAYNAIRDLGLAGSLVRLQGPGRTRGYLHWRAQFYPPEVAGIFRDAAALPDLDPDEIAMLALRVP